MKNNILIVCAHNDDELLGCAGYIQESIKRGDDVFVACISRASCTRFDKIEEKMLETHNALGVKNTFCGSLEAMKFDKIDHVEKVRFIENAIRKSECNIVVTHSDTDLHADHREVYNLVSEAVKLPQRFPGSNIRAIEKVLCMEVPSATDWSLVPFNANYYVPVTEEEIDEKIRLIKMYDDVIRPIPHPRSDEKIKALSIVRGSECGSHFAEAFKVVFQIG